MDRSLEVRTGESVAIRYELAGLGSRFLAVGLDFAIQVGVVVAVLLAFAAAGAGVRFAAIALAVSALSSAFPIKIVQAVLIALMVFALFALFVGYFIVFEVWWSGQTPGKRVVGIRVVRDAGFPVDVGASVIRNLVRIIEAMLGVYTIAAISALLSRENKRLGDFAAGTIVVRDRTIAAAELDAYVARELPDDDGLTAADRALIERFMARRADFEAGARAALEAQLAARVRPRLRADFSHLDDAALLEHLGRNARRG